MADIQNDKYNVTHTGDHPDTTIDADFVLVFDGKLSANKAFIDALLNQIQSRIGGLVRGSSYTLRELCGEEFWGQLDPNDHIVAGRCMKHLIRAGNLPLESAGKTEQNARLYRLK